MEPRPRIESGMELLARLIARPSLEGLDGRLFGDGPFARTTIELCGNICSGKTLLLTQLIAACILPSNCDGITIQGRDAGAVLINTDHHFRVSKLIRLMLGIVERACKLAGVEYSENAMRDRIIIPAIENLVVLDCYDNNQFKFTIETLDNILMNDHRIGLIAIDSISTFYWQDRESSGVWSIDRYMKNLLRKVQKHTFRHKIVMIYTRSQDFASKGQIKSLELADRPVVEKINYRIHLGSRCVIETATDKREVRFEIGDEGITWITEENS